MKQLYVLIILNSFAGGLFLFQEKSVVFPPVERASLAVYAVERAAAPSVKEINYFETRKDTSNWIARHRDRKRILRALSKEHVTQGGYSMRVEWNAEKEAELFLLFFPQDWENYAAFRFDVYNPGTAPIEYEVRVGDYFDTSNFAPHTSRFVSRGTFVRGQNRFVAAVSSMDKLIDLSSSRKLIRLWIRTPGCVFFIDNMRLER